MRLTPGLMLATCFVVIGVVGPVWHSFQVFFAALTREFGWTRADGALGFSILVIVYGLSSPICGALVDRFGPRVVVALGTLFLAAGFGASSQMNTLWEFYLYFGGLTALGFSAAGWIPVVTVMQGWFRDRIGTAIGIVSAGTGIGIMVFIPLDQYLIQTYGWRQTYLIMAIVYLVTLLPACVLLRPGHAAPARPVATPCQPVDADPRVVDHVWAKQTWTLRTAVRTGRFWFGFFAFALMSGSAHPVMAHQVVYMSDIGISALVAASAAGLIGIASVPAKIGWGYLADRVGREMTFSLGIGLVVAAIGVLWWLPALPKAVGPYLYGLMMGLGYAVTAALPPVVAADLFRGRGYGAIYGGLNLGTTIGVASGAWVAGAIFDVTGSYAAAFAMAAGAAVSGSMLLWLAAPRQVRLAPGPARRRAQVVALPQREGA